jgi:hypothetical protein
MCLLEIMHSGGVLELQSGGTEYEVMSKLSGLVEADVSITQIRGSLLPDAEGLLALLRLVTLNFGLSCLRPSKNMPIIAIPRCLLAGNSSQSWLAHRTRVALLHFHPSHMRIPDPLPPSSFSLCMSLFMQAETRRTLLSTLVVTARADSLME